MRADVLEDDYLRFHLLEFDTLEGRDIIGTAKITERNLYFDPTHLKLNASETVALIYGQ